MKKKKLLVSWSSSALESRFVSSSVPLQDITDVLFLRNSKMISLFMC